MIHNLILSEIILSLHVANLGSREESEVAGFSVFSHKRMVGYIRVNECPTGLENRPRRG